MLKARSPSAETSMSWAWLDGCKRIVMTEMAPWRQRFHPSISRYSAVDFDSTGRNFRSSEILPIKADSKQVVIVVTAATWSFSLASGLIGAIEYFLYVNAIAEKVSQLRLNSRKKTGETSLCPLKTSHVGWYQYAGNTVVIA